MGHARGPQHIQFDFYGVTVGVEALDRTTVSILDSLAIQFEHFACTPTKVAEVLAQAAQSEQAPRSPLIAIQLQSASRIEQSQRTKGTFLFRNRLCRVYTWAGKRLCDYGSGTFCHSSWARTEAGLHRYFAISGSNLEHLHEVAYLAILSAVGEELEVRGLVRLHALGLLYDNQALVLMMPSGCGKSSLAVMALKKDIKQFLFSDEIVLFDVRQQMVFPFPLPISLKPSVATSLGLPPTAGRSFKRKIFGRKLHHSIPRSAIAPPAPLGSVILCSQSENALLQPDLTKRLKARLALNILLGIGLPQMTEHLLRPSAALRLMTILFNRARAVWTIWRAHTLYRFEVSTRPQENFATLIDDQAKKIMAQEDCNGPLQ